MRFRAAVALIGGRSCGASMDRRGVHGGAAGGPEAAAIFQASRLSEFAVEELLHSAGPADWLVSASVSTGLRLLLELNGSLQRAALFAGFGPIARATGGRCSRDGPPILNSIRHPVNCW